MKAIELHARHEPGYEQRVAHALSQLRLAAADHASAIVQATSLGAEDMVITDLIARHRLPIAIATLDTGALHASTIALARRVEQHYGIPVERYAPRNESVVAFVRQHGDDAIYRSVVLRKGCCGIRKLEPLQRLLAGRTAWVTGQRREQSDARAEAPFAEPGSDRRIKFNPLADWSWADVWHYLRLHEVPYNLLHDQSYPSIGCAPCTRAVAAGEPFRSGRWWWEGEGRKECGLHSRPAPRTGRRDGQTSLQVPILSEAGDGATA